VLKFEKKVRRQKVKECTSKLVNPSGSYVLVSSTRFLKTQTTPPKIDFYEALAAQRLEGRVFGQRKSG
jgi:hypothetical protein